MVSICSIVSCVAAVYGVFQVVKFVVEVRPIVIPIVQEVEKGNVDVQKMLSGTTIRHDTVFVVHKDTIYLAHDKETQTDNGNSPSNQKLTAEKERHLKESPNHVSKQEREEIEEAENSFRQHMKEKMR